MPDILDSLKAQLPPEFFSEAAKTYGESEAGIFKTIHCLAPTFLVGLLEKCGDSHAIDPIFNSLRDFDPGILQNLDKFLEDKHPAPGDPREIAAQLNNTIFGAKTPAITNAVAAFSEVKPATVTALLGFTTCLLMSLLSQKIRADTLRPTALVRYLLSERNRFVSLLPAGVGSLLGMTDQAGAGTRTKSGFGWLWLLLAFLVLVAVLVYSLTNH